MSEPAKLPRRDRPAARAWWWILVALVLVLVAWAIWISGSAHRRSADQPRPAPEVSGGAALQGGSGGQTSGLAPLA